MLDKMFTQRQQFPVFTCWSKSNIQIIRGPMNLSLGSLLHKDGQSTNLRVKYIVYRRTKRLGGGVCTLRVCSLKIANFCVSELSVWTRWKKVEYFSSSEQKKSTDILSTINWPLTFIRGWQKVNAEHRVPICTVGANYTGWHREISPSPPFQKADSEKKCEMSYPSANAVVLFNHWLISFTIELRRDWRPLASPFCGKVKVMFTWAWNLKPKKWCTVAIMS